MDRLFGNAFLQALAANSTTPEFPACPCAVHEKQEFKQKITGRNNRKCHLHSWQSNQSHLASYTKCISWELKKNCERLQFHRLYTIYRPLTPTKAVVQTSNQISKLSELNALPSSLAPHQRPFARAAAHPSKETMR